MNSFSSVKDLASDTFEFFQSSANYSDRMIEKMSNTIDEFRKSSGIKELEVYEHFFFSNPGVVKISSQQWSKILFSTNIVFNTIITKFLKIYTIDIYGSKIYQFNNNDARVFRNKVNTFFNNVNEYIIPFNYEKVDKFVHELIKESFDNNYAKRDIIWKVFELSFLCSVFRDVSDDLTIIDTKTGEVKKESSEVDILDTITDEEKELVNSLFKSPIIGKAFNKIPKDEFAKVVDEFIRISIIWARRDK